MNELSGRGHEGVGSDIAPSYSGIADGTPVTTMPYVQLDITDKEAVAKSIREVKPECSGTLCRMDSRRRCRGRGKP